MSQRRLVVMLFAVGAVYACANAGAPRIGGDDVGDANNTVKDGPELPMRDAPTPPLDAAIDAAIDAPMIDAPPDAASGLFCTDNTMCTNAGECCIIPPGFPAGVCGTGVIVFGACIPQ
jgi:hypothetical protein